VRRYQGPRVIVVSLLLLVLVLIVAGGVGSVPIPPGEALLIALSRVPGVTLASTWPQTHEAILWNIRLPRVVLGMFTGTALATAGAAFQGIFKNPLADPYILGVSSGGGLGAAIAIALLGGASLYAIGTVPLFAFAGGLGTVVLVYRLAAVGRKVPVVALLLAGVAVGSLNASLISLILYFTRSNARDAILFWLMGGLSGANWAKVAWLLPYLAVGSAVLLYYGRELNAMLMGEEPAQHMGVEVEQVKRRVLVAGSLLSAAAVAFCGAIGFVGLVVPHLVRFLVGPDHRLLLPASALLGAVVLVTADTVARTILGAAEIPVGLVMAVIGGPFFLWLLRRHLHPGNQ